MLTPEQFTPMVAVNYREVYASCLTQFPELMKERVRFPGLTVEEAQQARDDFFHPRMLLFEWLIETPIVIWDFSLWDAAVKGADAFEGEVLGPIPNQLWLYNKDGYLPSDLLKAYEISEPVVISGLWLAHRRSIPGVIPIYILEPEESYAREQYLQTRDPRYGLPYFVVLGKRNFTSFVTGFWLDIMAAHRFMQQPFIAVEDKVLPRAERRRREKARQSIPRVQEVVLRKKEPTSFSSGEHRNYQCCFLVSGYWRKQEAPRFHQHEPVYVQAHVKGDLSKPFKSPSEKVYVVKR